MSVTEKVAYLKGLAEGLGVDDSTKEGKLLCAVVDALDDISKMLDGMEVYTTELSEQVDAIDEDLDALESDFYEDEDGYEDFEDFEDEEFYDVVCPSCEEEFAVDEDTLLEGSIECPSCGESLEFDIDECECGCHAEEDEE